MTWSQNTSLVFIYVFNGVHVKCFDSFHPDCFHCCDTRYCLTVLAQLKEELFFLNWERWKILTFQFNPSVVVVHVCQTGLLYPGPPQYYVLTAGFSNQYIYLVCNNESLKLYFCVFKVSNLISHVNIHYVIHVIFSKCFHIALSLNLYMFCFRLGVFRDVHGLTQMPILHHLFSIPAHLNITVNLWGQPVIT